MILWYMFVLLFFSIRLIKTSMIILFSLILLVHSAFTMNKQNKRKYSHGQKELHICYPRVPCSCNFKRTLTDIWQVAGEHALQIFYLFMWFMCQWQHVYQWQKLCVCQNVCPGETDYIPFKLELLKFVTSLLI